MRRCGIGLGSNLGDRLDNMRRAAGLVLQRVPGAELTAAAPVYETEPVDCPPGSGKFFNSVIEVACKSEPHALLRLLRGIEEELGRANHHAWHEPRTIDLDLLYCGELIVHDGELELPHPRIAQRAFVLVPLAEICGELVLPGFSENVGAMLARLPERDRALRCAAGEWMGDHWAMRRD